MDCPQTIINIAEERLKEGECLYNNELYSGSYYITGYVIELLLKARICKNLGVDGFFDNPKQFKDLVTQEMYKPFKVHNVHQLLILSGLSTQHEKEVNSSPPFLMAWSFIYKWNEAHRYLTNKAEEDAKNLLTSVKFFREWLTNYL